MKKTIKDDAGNVVVVNGKVGQVVKGDQSRPVRIDMGGKGMTITTLPNADLDWTRGYYSAVAALLRKEGSVTTTVRSLFEKGGDARKADSDDVALFREHGLLD